MWNNRYPILAFVFIIALKYWPHVTIKIFKGWLDNIDFIFWVILEDLLSFHRNYFFIFLVFNKRCMICFWGYSQFRHEAWTRLTCLLYLTLDLNTYFTLTIKSFVSLFDWLMRPVAFIKRCVISQWEFDKGPWEKHCMSNQLSADSMWGFNLFFQMKTTKPKMVSTVSVSE